MLKVVPIADGEAHLQNKVLDKKCYLCKKDFTDDMVLMRVNDKNMGFACEHHPGIVQEFLRQFRMLPIGWVQKSVKEIECVGENLAVNT